MTNPIKWVMWFNIVLAALDLAAGLFLPNVFLLYCSAVSGALAVACYYFAKDDE